MTAAAREEQVEIDLLLEALQRKFGYDFRGYSPATLLRRLHQARNRFACASFSELQHKLLHDSSVLPRLIADLTVPVSEMFRDPTFFRSLRESVIPHLRTYPFVRVWMAGCSTGEELYSLAIVFREEGLEDRTRIYATDISPFALKSAETGIYPLERLPAFTKSYQASGGKTSLSDYYTAAYNSAVFDRTLRARTVFADHSLASDSVFAEVQLVICRNVLIYFQRPLQDRAVGLFRESLVRKGFLGLGARESLRLTVHAGAFTELVRADRIYQKKGE